MAALSVEAAELLEIFQWLTPEQAARIMDDPAKAHRVEDEVADLILDRIASIRARKPKSAHLRAAK